MRMVELDPVGGILKVRAAKVSRSVFQWRCRQR